MDFSGSLLLDFFVVSSSPTGTILVGSNFGPNLDLKAKFTVNGDANGNLWFVLILNNQLTGLDCS
jgi:hypothetical protein